MLRETDGFPADEKKYNNKSGKVVRATVEETLQAMLEAKADAIVRRRT
jgi:hypothetical protein